jgi:hypothetical protein
MSPEGRVFIGNLMNITGRRYTKDDLAAIQYANELVSWRFIVIDLQELCVKLAQSIRSPESTQRTLLSEHQKSFTPFAFGYVKVLLFNPTKERDSLREDTITLEVV